MYRRYVMMVLIPLGLVWAGVYYLALDFQPLRGDLTRLGGYSENEFGWNGQELIFNPPLARGGTLNGQYDIAVLGDSFSSRTTPDRQTRLGSFWTDFLVADTGLSVGVFDRSRTPVEQYLASASFRTHPPKLVVYESVERALEPNLSQPARACPDLPPYKPFDMAIRPTNKAPSTIGRDRGGLLAEGQFDLATDYFKKNFIRSILGKNETPVVRFKLSRSDLFTSRRSTELLVIFDDTTKSRWSAAQWKNFACNLLQLRAEVESNGVTRFVALLAPDKGTVYRNYITPPRQFPNGTEILAVNPAIPMPRIDIALKTAAAAGVKDLYMPNDTHWGTAGSRIAAATVAQFLDNGGR